MPKKHFYERSGVFINLNKDSERDLMEALVAYTEELGTPTSTAVKTLIRKQLISEGKIKVAKVRI